MGAIGDGIAWKGAKRVAVRSLGSIDGLRGATVAVTGATGLIGAQVTRLLLEMDSQAGLGLKLVLPVRRVDRAREMFDGRGGIAFVPWSLGDSLDLGDHCDGFIHCACGTSSEAFLRRPVETSLGIIDGTAGCLKAAKAAGCSAFVYLSTMEVYGEPAAKPATEQDLGSLDPAAPRNSYPIAKLATENLVSSFGSEFGMRASCLRLAQTFGAGVRLDDGRVFAEFARCATAGKDITLLSDGSKRNCYLSVNDASSAILTILADGEAGGTFNVANPATYCSVLDMAKFVAEHFAVRPIEVRVEPDPEAQKRFRKGADIQLDISRLEQLGWRPTEGLEEMYSQMIGAWRQ